MEIAKKALKKQIVDKAIAFYNKLTPISDVLALAIEKTAKLMILEDGDILVRQNEVCHYFYYIHEGILVGETQRSNKKFVSWFCGAGESASSISGLYGRSASKETIYAVGKTILIAFDNSTILSWYDKYPESNIFMRKMFEYYLQLAEERISTQKNGSIRERYKYFMKYHQLPLYNMPLHILASYLDVKQNTLEKLISDEENLNNNVANPSYTYAFLTNFVEESKCYLDALLTLQGLADLLAWDKKILSEIIIAQGTNFKSFINFYRIQYIKELLKEHNKRYTIEGLAKQAGFNSRSSFFSIFKKEVGLSPTDFINSL